MQNVGGGGQIRCLMGDVQMANTIIANKLSMVLFLASRAWHSTIEQHYYEKMTIGPAL